MSYFLDLMMAISIVCSTVGLTTTLFICSKHEYFRTSDRSGYHSDGLQWQMLLS